MSFFGVLSPQTKTVEVRLGLQKGRHKIEPHEDPFGGRVFCRSEVLPQIRYGLQKQKKSLLVSKEQNYILQLL